MLFKKIAPNVSSNVAYAMGNIPLLGNLIQVVTFRDYSFEDANHKIVYYGIPFL